MGWDGMGGGGWGVLTSRASNSTDKRALVISSKEFKDGFGDEGRKEGWFPMREAVLDCSVEGKGCWRP